MSDLLRQYYDYYNFFGNMYNILSKLNNKKFNCDFKKFFSFLKIFLFCKKIPKVSKKKNVI